jgi:hypothetical protein
MLAPRAKDDWLCTPINDDAAQIVTTVSDSPSPDPSTLGGGTIESGTYWVTSDVYYQGTAIETMRQEFMIDTTAHTIRQADIESYVGTSSGSSSGGSASGNMTVYDTFTYSTSGDQLAMVSVCADSGTSQRYYRFSGTGRGATLTLALGSVWITYTKQ